jgi:multidrug efflux pump subunit AcrB
VGGTVGPFFEAMSVVVILCLMFSLVESKLILPAHLVHANIGEVDEVEIFSPYRTVPWYRRPGKFFQRIQRHVQHFLQALIHQHYQPLLERAVNNRGVTVAGFAAVLIITIGIMNSGIARVVIFDEVPGDFIHMQMTMQNGTAPEDRNSAMDRLEAAVLRINGDYLAEHPDASPPISHVGAFTGADNSGQIFVELDKDEDRPLQGSDISKIWRENAGEIAGIKDLTFSDGDGFGGGAPLSFNLNGDNIGLL